MQKVAQMAKNDRLFFLAFVLFGWIAVVMGFGPVVWKRFQGLSDGPASVVLQVHVFAFVGWMALLSTQVLLVRVGHTALHRILGLGLVVLLPVMVIAGMWTEIESQRRSDPQTEDDLRFFVTPLIETILFAGLAIAAFLKRNDPASHKRLILMATSIILVAAFNRWWGEALDGWLGNGYWAPILSIFFGPNLLMACGMAHDLNSNGTIHRTYLVAVPLVVAAEIVAGLIWHAAWWPEVARRIIGY